MIVYLRSIPPVHNAVIPVKFPVALRKEIEKSLNPITEPVEAPDQSDSMKRGRYLVKIGECLGCHTSHAEYSPGLNGGGNDITRFSRRAISAS